MRLPLLVTFSLIPLAACASNERRLDAAWERFQSDQAAALARAERVRDAGVERARENGDEDRLVALTTPPSSPVARVLTTATAGAIAYFAGDLEALARAQHVLDLYVEDMARLERAFEPPDRTR